MEIKSKVAKFGKERKIIEIPKAARDNFNSGEEVVIKKWKKMIDKYHKIKKEKKV